jgi:hypothetical protein
MGQKLFGNSKAVDIGCIEEVDAILECCAYRIRCHLIVPSAPSMAAGRRTTQSKPRSGLRDASERKV